jgi:hypothetical protein
MMGRHRTSGLRRRKEATYLFKHALVRDAAYGTLLREPRRALHAQVAETIERQFPEIANTARPCEDLPCARTDGGTADSQFAIPLSALAGPPMRQSR